MMRVISGVVAIVLYLLALVLMHASIPRGVEREAVAIAGPQGKPCLGTVWRPPAARAVILLGHGVTSNQSVMAMAAKAFARNGYIAVTFDFWGHGRSRERFDWSSNAAQVHAWCDWARQEFKDLPLVYLGHSMGGEAGTRAFVERPDVTAFVSLGMLTGQTPSCKMLIAAGRFEELFSGEEARRRVGDKADVLISPYSDHILETWDPVLLQGIIAWVNDALGLGQPAVFPWRGWTFSLLATIFGCAAALVLAERAAALLRRPAPPAGEAVVVRRRGFNPYRVAGNLLGYRGDGVPPRACTFRSAVIRGIVFGAVVTVLLALLLNGHMFTSGLNHPARCVTWIILTPLMAALFYLTASVMERIPLPGALGRFAVAALTRAVPLLVLGFVMRFSTGGLAFLGMILWILASVLVLLSVVHAMATRATGDYRAGAVASGVILAWITAFWIVLFWA